MRCRVFIDEAKDTAQDQYSEWAEGTVLSKDVIIHSHVIPPSVGSFGRLVIVVFYDERIHPTWDAKYKGMEEIT